MAVPVPDADYDYEHFTLDKLDRILPVGQTRQAGNVGLTLLSLESYRAGFVALILGEEEAERWTRPGPDDHELQRYHRALLIIQDAVDDRGNHYLARMRSGGGGGGGASNLMQHWLAYCLAPALDPAARTLALIFAQVERPHFDGDGKPAWPDENVVAGPWTVTFELDSSGGRS